MKKRMQALLLAILLTCNFIQAQELTPFKENTLWGYKDPSGTIVIPVRYTVAKPFDKELALVKLPDGKVAGIDARGNLVFELKGSYDSISEFYEEYAAAYTAKKVFIIDRKGKVVEDFSAPLVQNAQYLGEGIVGVASVSAYWGYFTIKGKALTKFSYGTPSYFKQGKTIIYDRYDPKGGLMDTKGTVLIPVSLLGFKESIQAGHYLYRSNSYLGNYDVVDESGKTILQTDFNYLHPAGENRLLYSITKNQNRAEQLVGLADKNYTIVSEELLPINYTHFENGHFVVTLSNKRFLVDQNGIPETTDGSFEYHIAQLLLPEDSTKIRQPHTWEQIDRLLNRSVAKGYVPAKEKLQLLTTSPFYQSKLASLKSAVGKQELDELVKQAEKGDTMAMSAMAKAYLTGTGRQKDTLQAISWLEKAAAQKSPHAANALAQLHIAQLNPEKAFSTLTPFKTDSICNALYSRLGNHGAMNYFKGYYYDSIGSVTTDRQNKAIEYYRKSMAEGNKDAAYILGRKYFDTNREDEAIAILKENAASQHLMSIVFLHSYYLGTKGGSINKNNKQSYSMMADHYFQQLKKHPDVTKRMLAAADRDAKKDQPDMVGLTPGTVIGVPNATGLKKVISSTSATGFHTQDGVYYSANARNAPAAYNGYVVLAGESDLAFRKTCGSCNGHKTVNKQVKSGSYVTKDVRYKTGSTISGDKKITTYTENNTYKTISEQCSRCNGRGYTY